VKNENSTSIDTHKSLKTWKWRLEEMKCGCMSKWPKILVVKSTLPLLLQKYH